MAQVTVQQLAEVVGASVERLLTQMKEAGLPHLDAEEAVSDDDKQTLLTYLKRSHGESTEAPKSESGNKNTTSLMILGVCVVGILFLLTFGAKRNFERFRVLCEEAFIAIRRHGSLIISLLAMMIQTGLPELSSEQDLNAIRATLHLDRSEDEALEHFRKDFNESLRNAWTISLDWWFHMLNQKRARGIK